MVLIWTWFSFLDNVLILKITTFCWTIMKWKSFFILCLISFFLRIIYTFPNTYIQILSNHSLELLFILSTTKWIIMQRICIINICMHMNILIYMPKILTFLRKTCMKVFQCSCYMNAVWWKTIQNCNEIFERLVLYTNLAERY